MCEQFVNIKFKVPCTTADSVVQN